MTTIEVQGRRIALLEAGGGDATPLLCLHSTGLGAVQWRRLAQRAARSGRRVVAPDLLGYGASEAWLGPEPFTTEADDAVVRAVLERMGTAVHLVGHSYGGRLALRAALHSPDRVRSLALFEPVAFGVIRHPPDAAALADLEAHDTDGRFLDPSFGGSEAWMARFVDYWSGPGAWADLSPEQRAPFMASARKVFEEVAETVNDPIGRDAYRALEHPALLMYGAHSREAARRVCVLLAQVMPGARAVEHPDGVHMSPLLHGAAVSAEILAFVDQVDGAPWRPG